jgi:hypothetical protein
MKEKKHLFKKILTSGTIFLDMPEVIIRKKYIKKPLN